MSCARAMVLAASRSTTPRPSRMCLKQYEPYNAFMTPTAPCRPSTASDTHPLARGNSSSGKSVGRAMCS